MRIGMDERAELEQELEAELQWVDYRQNMLEIMEEKLMQMRELAEYARDDDLTSEEIELINKKLNNLNMQVKALDDESRRTEDGRILE